MKRELISLLTIRKRITILNGNISLTAEQAELEVRNAIANNLLGNSSILSTEFEDVMGNVEVATVRTELATALV